MSLLKETLDTFLLFAARLRATSGANSASTHLRYAHGTRQFNSIANQELCTPSIGACLHTPGKLLPACRGE